MKIRLDKEQANININFSITNDKAMHFINYMASITKNLTIDINLVNKKLEIKIYRMLIVILSSNTQNKVLLMAMIFEKNCVEVDVRFASLHS